MRTSQLNFCVLQHSEKNPSRMYTCIIIQNDTTSFKISFQIHQAKASPFMSTAIAKQELRTK